MTYYIAQGDQQHGPLTHEELLADVARGRFVVRPDTLVWRVGMADWEPMARLPELAGLLTPPADAAGPVPEPAPLGVGGGPVAETVAPPIEASPEPRAPFERSDDPPAPPPPPMVDPPPVPVVAYRSGPGDPAHLPYAGQPLPAGGMAMAALICGIVGIPLACAGLGMLTPVCAILAIIFGHVGRGQARRGEAGGYSQATTGMTLGYVTLAILVGIVLIAFLVGLTILGIGAAAN